MRAQHTPKFNKKTSCFPRFPKDVYDVARRFTKVSTSLPLLARKKEPPGLHTELIYHFFQDLAFQPTTQSRSSSMISGYSLIFPRKRSRVSGPFHVCFSRIECAGVYCVHQYVHRPLADLWFTLDTHTYFYEWPRRSHPCKNISMAFSLPPPYGRR